MKNESDDTNQKLISLYAQQSSSEEARRAKGRKDGHASRNTLLNAAGRLFAKKGPERTTIREISLAAGTNIAAVNYHFGSKDGLYIAALLEAHRQIATKEELDAIANANVTGKEKLRTLLKKVLTLNRVENWAFPLLLREIASPAAAIPPPLMEEFLPKLDKVRNIIKEISGLPEKSLELTTAAGMLFLSCAMIILFPDKARLILFPALSEGSDAVLNSMLAYIMGGMEALKQRAEKIRDKN